MPLLRCDVAPVVYAGKLTEVRKLFRPLRVWGLRMMGLEGILNELRSCHVFDLILK